MAMVAMPIVVVTSWILYQRRKQSLPPLIFVSFLHFLFLIGCPGLSGLWKGMGFWGDSG
jgi:hypothetical protein